MTRFASLAFALLLVLVASAGAERAQANVTCNFNGGALTIQSGAPIDEARIVRSGDDIVVARGQTPVDCGTQATVYNTHVIAHTDISGGESYFTIDLRGGPFSPGQVDEPGNADEIDIQALMGSGPDRLYVWGGPGNDFWRLGATAVGSGVNLNAQLESGSGAAPDSDVDLRDVELAALFPGPGDDRVLADGGPEFAGPLALRVDANPEFGQDELVGGSGDDNFADYPGPDRISGGAGADSIFDVGPTSGNDDFDGGPGLDTVAWGEFTAPIRVDLRLSDRQDTGAGGNDLITGIESATTSDGDDVLIGTDGDNRLSTGDGDDLIAGLGGADTIRADDGRDTASYATPPVGVRGGVRVDLTRQGVDQDTGGAGIDRLEGVNNLIGSPFPDVLTGSTGDNRFEIRDGSPDRVNCSAGADTVVADVEGKDLIDDECETVQLDDRPETGIESGPASLSNDPTPSFRFAATKPGSTFECSLDGAPFDACAGVPTLAEVSDGAHRLRVRAVDMLGAFDVTPAERAFSVDTVAPRITRVRLVRGGRLRYRLSEAASVMIARGARKRLVQQAASGLKRIAIPKGRRTLVTLTATDAAGNRSLRVRLRFRVR